MASLHEPGSVYWKLIEPHWIPLNKAWDAGERKFLAKLSAIPLKAQLLYAAHWCKSEVDNGGFYQFFYNTSGILAPEAVKGFGAVGLVACADSLADAMKFFGSPYPRVRELRLDKLPQQLGKRAEWDPFRPLDERFDDCISAERHAWDHAADAYASRA